MNKLVVLLVWLVVAGAIAYFLMGFSRSDAHYSDVVTTPVGKVDLVGLDCDTDKNFGIVSLTVRNVGPVALGYTRAYVSVDGKVMDAPASPAAIGALVTYDFATGASGSVGSCQLVTVQDYEGRALI